MKTNIALLATVTLLGLTIPTAKADPVPASYPLKTCVVSKEEIGEHGKPVKVTAPDGTDVYLCCKQCVKDFKKDPAKYAKMVKDAQKK